MPLNSNIRWSPECIIKSRGGLGLRLFHLPFQFILLICHFTRKSPSVESVINLIKHDWGRIIPCHGPHASFSCHLNDEKSPFLPKRNKYSKYYISFIAAKHEHLKKVQPLLLFLLSQVQVISKLLFKRLLSVYMPFICPVLDRNHYTSYHRKILTPEIIFFYFYFCMF